MGVHLVEGEEFDQMIQNTRRKYLVVDFYADWCGPCIRFAPTFKKLSEDYPHIKFLKVNIDDSEEIAQNLNITSLPTFMFFQSGKLIPIRDPIIGVNKRAIVSTLEELSSSVNISSKSKLKKSSKKPTDDPIGVYHDSVEENSDVVANDEEFLD